MFVISPKSLLPATAFRPEGVTSLADVSDRVTTLPAGTERRDMLSAFRVLAKRLDLDLAATPASAVVVRRLFETAGPVALGVNPQRYANIRSLVVRAVARFGMRPGPLALRAPLSPDWAALLDTIKPLTFRYGVRRLAHYCSAVGIAPEAVRTETLLGLHEATDAECLTMAPRRIVRNTIASWNGFAQTVPGWPPIVLVSPWKKEHDVFPRERFPASFEADVAAWVERMSRPDPLDPFASLDDATPPPRALRPATIGNYVKTFRRFASGLARRGVVPLEEISGLAAFFEGDRLQEGLRHFLQPGKDPAVAAPDTRQAHQIACMLLGVARHYLRVNPEALARIERLCRRLDPKRPKVMGARNRERLDQFDDPENVARLLSFPQAEAGRAMRLRNPKRRASGIERALAVALLIDTSVRIKNLRHIRPGLDLRRVGTATHLTVEAAEVKNGRALAFELAEETVELLNRFVNEHRPHLPGHEGPYLFAGKSGGPRSDNALRAAISGALKTHCGLTMSPHLFRHAIAKIIVELDPSMYAAVSRHLGHGTMSITLTSYLGSETRAASRKLNAMLRDARDNPDLGED